MPPAMQDVEFNLTPADRRELPALPLNAPFLLAYHRNGWNVRLGKAAKDDKIVPNALPYVMECGLHGIGESMRGMTGDIVDLLEVRIKKAGGRMLPPNEGPVAPWNPEGRGYVSVIEARDSDGRTGKHYLAKWDEAHPNSPATHLNAARYDAFVAFWQAEGLVPAAPPRDIILSRISDLRERVGRIAEQGAGKPATEREAAIRREYACWVALDSESADAGPVADAPVDLDKRKPRNVAPEVGATKGKPGPRPRPVAPAVETENPFGREA